MLQRKAYKKRYEFHEHNGLFLKKRRVLRVRKQDGWNENRCTWEAKAKDMNGERQIVVNIGHLTETSLCELETPWISTMAKKHSQSNVYFSSLTAALSFRGRIQLNGIL